MDQNSPPIVTAPVPASTGARAAYRRFYPMSKQFKEVTQPRDYPLLRLHLVLRPTRPGVALDGMVLHLLGASVSTLIPVDALAGIELPLDPVANEQDAVLHVNRPEASIAFHTQYTIRLRPDGAYPLSYLKTACAQGLAAGKSMGIERALALFGKRCSGVVFQFRDTVPAPALALRSGDAAAIALPAIVSYPYGPKIALRVATATLRFADWPANAIAHTAAAPAVIDFLFD